MKKNKVIGGENIKEFQENIRILRRKKKDVEVK